APLPEVPVENAGHFALHFVPDFPPEIQNGGYEVSGREGDFVRHGGPSGCLGLRLGNYTLIVPGDTRLRQGREDAEAPGLPGLTSPLKAPGPRPRPRIRFRRSAPIPPRCCPRPGKTAGKRTPLPGLCPLPEVHENISPNRRRKPTPPTR